MTDIKVALREYLESSQPASLEETIQGVARQESRPIAHRPSPVLVATAAAVVIMLVIGSVWLLAAGDQSPVITQPPRPSSTIPQATTTVSETVPEPVDPADADWMDAVIEVVVAQDGLVYAAAPIGIASLDGTGDWTPIGIDELPEGSPVDTWLPGRMLGIIALGPDGDLWAGGTSWSSVDDEDFGGAVITTWGGEEARALTWVAHYDCGRASCSWQVFTTDLAAGHDIGDMVVSADGTVYASAGENMLLAFDGTEWRAHRVPGLPTAFDPEGSVWPWSGSLAVDVAGVVWGGTNGEGRGLFSFDGTVFTQYTTEDGLPGDNAFQVTAAADGTIWVATDILYNDPATASREAAAGIASFDGTVWTTYTIADGLLSNDAVLTASSDGTVWAVHYEIPPYGYSHFDGTQWTPYPSEPPVGGFRATASPDGTLWTSSDQGLISFDGTTRTIHPSPFPRT